MANDKDLMEKYAFEVDYGDGRGFVQVVPSKGAHAGWSMEKIFLREERLGTDVDFYWIMQVEDKIKKCGRK